MSKLEFLIAAAIVGLSNFLPEVQAKTVHASWYGPGLEGNKMANGERFDPSSETTVAHKTLPLGTWVLLYNPENSKTAIAEVRDRGPFIKGRSLDVSEALAEKLGFKEQGVAPLKIILPH